MTIVPSRIYHAYYKCTWARTDFKIIVFVLSYASVRTDIKCNSSCALSGWYHSSAGKPPGEKTLIKLAGITETAAHMQE